MADYYNDNNRNSGKISQRRLEDIFSDVDASYDYDSAGSAGGMRGGAAEEGFDSYEPDGSAGARNTSSGSSPSRTASSGSRASRPASSGSSAQRRPAASRSSAQRQSSGRTSAGASAGSSARRAAGSSSASRTRSASRATRPAGPEDIERRSSRAADSSERRSSRVPDSSERHSSRVSDSSSERRSSRKPAARSQAALNRKRKKKFRKYLLIYVAVLVVILIIGCIIFSSYLASYEKDQPSHVAEAIVDTYKTQEGIVAFLTENAAKTGASDNIGEIAQTYATNIAGKQISYRENNDFRPDNPAYDITADGSIVAKVTLMPATASDSFDKSKWTIQNLNVTEYLPNALTITVEAPADATVTVGGKVLDDSYIESTGIPAILENSVQFLANPPQYNTYRVGGLLSEPEVTVSDDAGTEYGITKIDNSYTASPKADQAFIDSVQDRVYDAIDNYATYFIHMSFELANYIVYGSELYSYIFGSDTMDPIATALYMFEDIESYDFVERSADNYIKYCDDCFTVDIKYALDMKFTDPTYEDNNQKMDATWVFVIEPLDGSWCISDIITH